LIYLPILGVVMALMSGRAGWRGSPWSWPRASALGATAATSAFLLVLSAYRQDALLARAALGASIIVAVFPFTGALIGWGLATWCKRSR